MQNFRLEGAEMNRKISTAIIGAIALFGSAIVGGTPAYAVPAASTLILTGGNGVFQLDPIAITATASNVGTVKFFAADVAIPGCEGVVTATVAPYTAKCLWTPAAGGAFALTGSFTPTDTTNFAPIISVALNVKVGVPQQGIVSPISIYVDTVLASGAKGVLAPRFGTGCSVTSQYIVGQNIVFRIFANNADEGGVAMEPKNTANAYIEISGLKEPIPLRYGNHSGGAFWVAVLRTGPAPAFNSLGVINYKVTFVAKGTSNVKVLAIKRLLVRDVAGALVRDVAGKLTFKTVSFYRTRVLTNPIEGATGSYSPTWAAAASLLTLYALPTS